MRPVLLSRARPSVSFALRLCAVLSLAGCDSPAAAVADAAVATADAATVCQAGTLRCASTTTVEQCELDESTQDNKWTVHTQCTLDADYPTCIEANGPARCVDLCFAHDLIPEFEHSARNPVLSPIGGSEFEGGNALSGPDVMRVSDDLCFMWYAALGADALQRVFVATSTDCESWSRYPTAKTASPVLEQVPAADPSVIWIPEPMTVADIEYPNGVYFMYFSAGPAIHAATSEDGLAWTTHGEVIGIGDPDDWDAARANRPSAGRDFGAFYVAYDGDRGDSVTRVGTAVSFDGLTFIKSGLNPVFDHPGAHAVDAEGIDRLIVMVRAGTSGISAATSSDGDNWCDKDLVFGISGASWDARGHNTPALLASDDAIAALFFSAVSDDGSEHIAQVYPANRATRTRNSVPGMHESLRKHCVTQCRARGHIDGLPTRRAADQCHCVDLPSPR